MLFRELSPPPARRAHAGFNAEERLREAILIEQEALRSALGDDAPASTSASSSGLRREGSVSAADDALPASAAQLEQERLLTECRKEELRQLKELLAKRQEIEAASVRTEQGHGAMARKPINVLSDPDKARERRRNRAPGAPGDHLAFLGCFSRLCGMHALTQRAFPVPQRGYSLLHDFCARGNALCVAELVAAGAPVNDRAVLKVQPRQRRT